MTCITITFGDCSENNVGMEKIGNMSENGYTSNELNIISSYLKKKKLRK